MTRRERLADWISGGALTRARDDAKLWKAESNDGWTCAIHRACYLQAIAAATASGRSGTAKMVNRMAREALE